MAQQMVGKSHHGGSVTYTERMTARYAVVNPPFKGLHLKPQDLESLRKRKDHWLFRNLRINQSKRRSKK